MTALSADRDSSRRDGVDYAYPCAASKTFYTGAIVFLDTSGNAEPASTATGKICAGVAQAGLTSTSAAAEKVKVKSGVFRFVNGESITKAHIGDVCYADDDQTVMRTSTGRSAVGAIVDVDSEGVWVSIQAPLAAATAGLLAANNLSDLGTLATAQSNLGLQDSTLDANFDTTTYRQKDVAGGAAYTVGSAADGDSIISTSTDNGVITLPDISAAVAGKRITVQNRGADGAAKVSISPHSSDKIKGGVHGAATGDLVSFSGTADKDAINTKATAKQGDYLVLVADGTDTWWVIGGKGVWASEP